MKIAFIHARPAPHPSHAAMGHSLDSVFHVVDPYLRWNGIEAPRIKRYLSWLVCAALFPEKSSYDLFLSDGCHVNALLMRKLGLLNDRQRVASLMGDQTLYFLKTNYYPSSTQRMLMYALQHQDAIFCIGKMQSRIAEELFEGKSPSPEIFLIPNEIFDDRGMNLAGVQPDLENNQLLVVANGPYGFRSWYKGIDFVLDVFTKLLRVRPELKLNIVGEWTQDFQDQIRSEYRDAFPRAVFSGATKDLRPLFSSSCCLLHLARGDAYPLAVMESLAAGLPAIVSEWTGSGDTVADVDPRLIVPLDVDKAVQAVLWYLDLSMQGKKLLSDAGRVAVSRYTPERAFQSLHEAAEKTMQLKVQGR
jgi:glycosyltransferase involved in cell wall biosynthesis